MVESLSAQDEIAARGQHLAVGTLLGDLETFLEEDALRQDGGAKAGDDLDWDMRIRSLFPSTIMSMGSMPSFLQWTRLGWPCPPVLTYLSTVLTSTQ